VAEGAQNHGAAVAAAQLGYIGLGVSDLATWKEFATQILGFQDNGQSASGDVYLRIDDYHHRFILIPNGADDIAFYGWEVKDGPVLDQMAARLRASGFEVTEGTAEETDARMVRRLVKFRDPDGIAAELYFGALVDHGPFISPRVVHGFKANSLGWGHMVLRVQDPDAYVGFLTEVLGARITDYISSREEPQLARGTFLHVNPRHHSVAIGKNPDAKGRKLNHIMVELNNIDDVGIAFSLFQQRGIPVGNLGRHTNDKMISFYGVTPSGYAIEYGYGGLLIQDESMWEVQVHRAASIWGHGRPDRPTK
jgi:2,3-dihydroxybiphenyl 1,2-dioxygenase